MGIGEIGDDGGNKAGRVFQTLFIFRLPYVHTTLV